MLQTPFPRTAGELSAAWLTESLRRRGAIERARVVAVDSEPLGVQGMTSETYRVCLGYDAHEPGAPTRLIAKFASQVDASRTFLHALGLYERELRFYSEVAGEASLRTPECFHAELQIDSGHFVLLLEDVEGTPGVCDLETLEQTLCAIAALHARYWDAPALRELDWVGGTRNSGALAARLAPALACVEARFGDVVPPEVARAVAFGVEHLPQLMAGHATRPRTLIHGDLHAGQVITTPDGPCLLDWQTTAIGSPGRDVARILAMTLPPMARLSHERRLLEVYREALEAHGVRDYDTRSCLRDYRSGLVTSAIMNVFAAAELDQARIEARRVQAEEAGEPCPLEILFGRIGHALTTHRALDHLEAELSWLEAAA